MPTTRASFGFTRKQSIWVSRLLIVSLVGLTAASYRWSPSSAGGWALDLVLRAYLHFLLGALAHEGAHGHLGLSRSGNVWWARLALLPTTVPSVTFRMTHAAHHAHTNEPGRDPDAFLDTPHRWQRPLRALCMPHHWVLWLARRGKLKAPQWREYVLTYVTYLGVYALFAPQVGVQRFVVGLLGAAVLHSMILWFPFAILTHQGYRTGPQEERSHDYRSGLLFWLTCGLSLHRAHHLYPHHAWLQLAAQIPKMTWRAHWTVARDIRSSAQPPHCIEAP